MKKTNFSVINYIRIIAVAIIIAILLVFIFGNISEKITDKANKYYMSYYIDEVKGFSSPWYEKGLHIVDEAFIYNLKDTDSNIVYVIGSSVSSNSINDDTVDLDSYSYKKLVCGNGSYRSNRIFCNFIEELDLCKEKDIIKYEVSFSTFRNVEKTITETILDKWGKYSVDENLDIVKNPGIMSPIYAINLQLIKIQNVWELITSYWDQNVHSDRYEEPRGYGNFKNNYFNYETVANSCHFADEYKESVIEDINRINSRYTEIVEISPIPMGLLNTEYGQTLNKFIDDELIPYLDSNEIRYIDLRYEFADDEFADGVHLSYKARIKYTDKLNGYINKVIKDIRDGE